MCGGSGGRACLCAYRPVPILLSHPPRGSLRCGLIVNDRDHHSISSRLHEKNYVPSRADLKKLRIPTVFSSYTVRWGRTPLYEKLLTHLHLSIRLESKKFVNLR